MANSTDPNDGTNAGFDNTPKGISKMTWIMIAILAVVVLAGILMIGGFFRTVTTGDERQPPSNSSNVGP